MAFNLSLQAGDRPPAVAGQFYPDDPGELTRTVDGYLAAAEKVSLPGALVAMVVPHAGYPYSGPVAAWGFKNMGADWPTVVLLGLAHRVPVKGAAVYGRGNFLTPLGKVAVDEALAEKILSSSDLFEDFPKAHTAEHSLEVELPFLQRTLKNFKIVPILMNTEDTEICRRVGETLAKTLRGKKALLLISSDMSHYPDRDTARRVDLTTLLALERMDPEYFWLTNRTLLERGEKNLSCAWCGESGLLAGLWAAKGLGADRGVLLRYANSGDVEGIGRADQVVGYGAMAFVSAPGKPAALALTESQKKGLLAEARGSIQEDLDGASLAPAQLSADPALNLPAAVFVTLTKNGALRGCIGTTEARATLREGVRAFARSAAFEDPRFPGVRKNELASLHIEISVLSPLSPIPDHNAVVPGKHGVVVRQGNRSGLFLPTVWEQLPDKNAFLSELCSQKAGLPRDCWKDPGTQLLVFTTDVFEEGK